MQLFVRSYAHPAHNLAADELLLELAERGEIGPVLRFWESPSYFVTLGYTNRAATEANLENCARENVPILRRVSGGGTVLQGPGSWNYAVVAPIPGAPNLDIEGTNRFVMERNRDLLRELCGQNVEIRGHTDLAIDGRKFSGNAQRRKARFFLFHGTILLDFDLPLVAKFLGKPAKEPDYRGGRTHGEFIRNLPVSRADLETAFARAWGANEIFGRELDLDELVAQKYALDSWNLRF